LGRLDTLIKHGHASEEELKSLRVNVECLRLGTQASSLGPEALDQIRSLLNLTDKAVLKVREARVLDSLRFEMMNERFEDIEDAHVKTFDWIYGRSDHGRDSNSIGTEVSAVSASSLPESEEHDIIDDDSYDARRVVDEEATNRGDSLESLSQAQQSMSDQEDNAGGNKLSDRGIDSEVESTLSDGERSLERAPWSHRPSERSSVDVYEIPEEDLKRMTQARECFVDWLEHGEGIFHIAGKPGSGKSTLMKYLCRHHQTEQHLRLWAGNDALVLAKFFFWKPGSSLQKSLKGLVRGLLYCLLSESPDLIPTAFPVQWDMSSYREKIGFEQHEIQAAFDTIISSQQAHRGYKFAFFIDGLDEFEGDHAELIRKLHKWTKTSQHVKICVSSREWAMFQESFGDCPKWKLQDLTFSDIKRFVRDCFRDRELTTRLGDTSSTIKLEDVIIHRCEGVFLWASLILRHIEDGIANGDSVQDLLGKIKSLPNELEAMFQGLLDTINRPDRKLAYAMLKMALFSVPYYGECLLIHYSFLEEYLNDRNFATKSSLSFLTEEEILTRHKRTRKRIYGICKGFLEVIPLRTSSRPRVLEIFATLGDQVRFTHRSIVEFLSSPQFQARVDCGISEFDPFDALCQAFICQIRSIRLPNFYYAPKVASQSLRSFVEPPGLGFSHAPSPSFKNFLIDALRAPLTSQTPVIESKFCSFLDAVIGAVSELDLPPSYLVYEDLYIYNARIRANIPTLIVIIAAIFGYHEFFALHGQDYHVLSAKKWIHLETFPLSQYRQRLPSNSRIIKTLKLYFDDGGSPNEQSLSTKIPIFHLEIATFFWYGPVLAKVAFMLYYGANPNCYIILGPGKWRCGDAIGWRPLYESHIPSLQGQSGEDETTVLYTDRHRNLDNLLVETPSILRVLEANDWRLSLRTLVGFWFPEQAEQLQEVIDWILALNRNVTIEDRAELQEKFGGSLKPMFDEECPHFVGWECLGQQWPDQHFFILGPAAVIVPIEMEKCESERSLS
jgi:hypothetical protein